MPNFEACPRVPLEYHTPIYPWNRSCKVFGHVVNVGTQNAPLRLEREVSVEHCLHNLKSSTDVDYICWAIDHIKLAMIWCNCGDRYHKSSGFRCFVAILHEISETVNEIQRMDRVGKASPDSFWTIPLLPSANTDYEQGNIIKICLKAVYRIHHGVLDLHRQNPSSAHLQGLNATEAEKQRVAHRSQNRRLYEAEIWSALAAQCGVAFLLIVLAYFFYIKGPAQGLSELYFSTAHAKMVTYASAAVIMLTSLTCGFNYVGGIYERNMYRQLLLTPYHCHGSAWK